MPISNLNNTHLSTAQVQALEKALKDLETAMQPLTVNLKPDERKRYGRVDEQNKLIIDKVYDYHAQSPQLSRPDIDWGEFVKDYDSRKTLGKLLNRLDDLRSRLNDAKVLHDFDNYTNALEDYGYTSFMASSSTPGYQNKHAEMRQFFTRNKGGNGDTDTPTPPQS